MTFEVWVALIGLLGAIIGGGITSLTNWLIAQAERTKFARERLWDLRRDAYTKIIASIVPAARVAENMRNGFEKDGDTYSASEDWRKATKAYGSHRRAAEDAFHVNRLMLSEDFARAFLRMLRDLDDVASDPYRTPTQAAQGISFILEVETEKLIQVGLSEISASAG